ncbi:NAD(P)-dependent oxidoreductase [Hydrotalea sp.]|uniref:NAD(P)-dependent oxidoreductase n=1 Tax=Hydrotalea sp. TaxID=2881279 RepID=UPI003D139B62
MIKIGLIKEGKVPSDSRVALIPAQCKWLMQHFKDINIVVEASNNRCFSDEEYKRAGIAVVNDISDCDILMGIKEVPKDALIANKTYLFFSHTRKKQPYNQVLFHTMIDKKITLIDYECLEHEDGQRVIGFGFFAGVVGAHNGMMCYGNRTGLYKLGRVYEEKDYRSLIHQYFGLKLPNVKIAVTGSGRVAHGILEVMNLMGITEVEPDEYLEKKFTYPVYVQLKGPDLFTHKHLKTYQREHFHSHPTHYKSRFLPYAHCSDILMNGIFWTEDMPRLFDLSDIDEHFAIQTISDITDDAHGSIPINLGDQTIEDPVYGVDRKTFTKTAPYLPGSIDVIAVGNLPNELPRDASRYFGEQLIKHVLPDLLGSGNDMVERATILKQGQLTNHFNYLADYAVH